MYHDKMLGALEAVLFAAGEPLTVAELAQCLQLDKPQVWELLSHLEQSYEEEARGLMLRQVADGYQLVTKPVHYNVVSNLGRKKEVKLTNAAMETLAIIAFKQPITKQEIEHIRGVRIEKIMSKLLEMELIRELGRKDTIGRPILYGTTDTFLQCFGLNDISDLPELPEADRSILEHEQLDLFAEAELPEQEQESEE